jgi:hypothetical protein
VTSNTLDLPNFPESWKDKKHHHRAQNTRESKEREERRFWGPHAEMANDI